MIPFILILLCDYPPLGADRTEFDKKKRAQKKKEVEKTRNMQKLVHLHAHRLRYSTVGWRKYFIST